MNNPNNLRIHERLWLDLFTGIPVALAIFPFPFVLPAALVYAIIDQPGKWPILLYFLWLAIALYLIYLNEKDPKP